MKRLLPPALALLCLLALAGCGGGELRFYDSPTHEDAQPVIAETVPLSPREAKELRRAVKNLKGLTDDYAVDRLAYHFDGDFSLAGSEQTYFFSYQHNVIYYDHCFGAADEAEMEYIKSLR